MVVCQTWMLCMAEIIPALTKEVLARMIAGEKRLAQHLKDLL